MSDLKWAYSEADQSYGSGLRFKQVDTTHGGQLEFYTDNASGSYTKQMQITENGHMTKPNQPSFRAASSSGISTGMQCLYFSTGWSSVNNGQRRNLTIIIVDTYTFTCPVAGLITLGFHGNVRDVGVEVQQFCICSDNEER